MRPRIIHEVSRCLALRLERGLDGGSEETRLPVFLCHPVEVLERDRAESAHASGVLYLYRVDPERDHSRAPVEFRSATTPGARHAVTTAGLSVRLRFAFLVVGGTHEDELCIFAGALDEIYRRPWIDVAELESGAASEATVSLSPVSQPDAWREIGLEEHRLIAVFEAHVPLGTEREEEVAPILERDLDVRVSWRSGGAT